MSENYPMLEAKRWKRASNYGGTEFPNYYTIVTQTRDSGLLQRNNHKVVWERLKEVAGEGDPNAKNADEDWVINPSFGHWAVGWLEVIMVRDDAPEKVLMEAESILTDLDDYPILDEGSYSDQLCEEMAERWERMSHWERVDMCKEHKVDGRKARRKFAPEELDEALRDIVEG